MTSPQNPWSIAKAFCTHSKLGSAIRFIVTLALIACLRVQLATAEGQLIGRGMNCRQCTRRAQRGGLGSHPQNAVL